MRTRALIVGSFAATALLSTVALAKGEHTWACSDAVKQFCSEVQPGGGRVLACLQQHEGELSPDCATASKKAQAHYQAFESACGSDIATLCKSDSTHPWKCLKSQETQLSASCKAFTAKAHHERTEME